MFVFERVLILICSTLYCCRPEIDMRRQWEKSPHPYIFFNADQTLSFYGLHIGTQMDLIDERSGEVLEQRILTRELYTCLRAQRVEFNQSFHQQSRAQKLVHLCR